TPLLWQCHVAPSHWLRWAPPSLQLHRGPPDLRPRSPEPWTLPWPSGSSVSPGLVGSPSLPWAPPSPLTV
ncbi:hypothetical protein M9458_001965, partial [Cirrhinus mrigala]